MIEALLLIYLSLLLLLTMTEIKGKHKFTAKYFYETSQLNWQISTLFSIIINIIMIPEKIIYYILKTWRYENE